MNTEEVANRLVQLCREGRNLDAINELYADDVVSLEPEGDSIKQTNGREAVIEHNKKWFESLEETHDTGITGPLVAATHFTCTMSYDVTMKGFGRMQLNEVCVYAVKDGKIVEEQFFYRL
ncbi:MAG: nuclear transport factor 2 family protein [Mucilaginibacter sp.]